MQTTHRDAGPSGMSNQAAFQPPDIPPKLFTLPKVRAYALELCGITPFQADLALSPLYRRSTS